MSFGFFLLLFLDACSVATVLFFFGEPKCTAYFDRLFVFLLFLFFKTETERGSFFFKHFSTQRKEKKNISLPLNTRGESVPASQRRFALSTLHYFFFFGMLQYFYTYCFPSPLPRLKNTRILFLICQNKFPSSPLPWKRGAFLF